MDDPHLPADEHALALRGLRRINFLSRTAAQMSEPLINLARRDNLKQLSLLDIACGGADVPIGVCRIAKQHGITVNLNLLDCSPTALALASQNAQQLGFTCSTRQADLAGDWADSTYDVVTCSLFLHHLPSMDAVIAVLAKMKVSAKRLVIVSDLRRSRSGLLAAWVGGRLLSRSPIVHFDAPTSVRAAWTIDELRTCAQSAGMATATIQTSFPQRMRLIYEI